MCLFPMRLCLILLALASMTESKVEVLSDKDFDYTVLLDDDKMWCAIFYKTQPLSSCY